MENNPQEEQELIVEETPIEEEPSNFSSFKKKYLKVLIEFILATLLYLVASSCNKFKGLNEALEVQHMEVFEYTKYIMVASYILTFIGVLILILKLCNVNLNFLRDKINHQIAYNILDWVVILPICVAIATTCFSFLFTLTNVSGTSMNPNINNEDRLLVTYPSQYERFDVVVLKVDKEYHLVDGPDLYLKRIIGLPGEFIDYRFQEGYTQLYINGEKVTEYFYTETELRQYLTYNTSTDSTPFRWTEKCFIGSDIRREFCDTVDGHMVIPEGYYFVLGDNRIGSKDSRNIGLIKEEDIIGTATYIINNIFKPEKIY